MHEIQTLEGVVVLDTAVHVRAALLARVAVDRGVGVDDAEFVFVGCYADSFTRDDADDGEERPGGFPAFRTAAGVVVCDVALEVDGYPVGWAFAV